jgi:hypothetical protein
MPTAPVKTLFIRAIQIGMFAVIPYTIVYSAN